MTRKDFTQTALDVFKQATRQEPKTAPEPVQPAPKPKKQTAPKVNKGAAKKTGKKAAR